MLMFHLMGAAAEGVFIPVFHLGFMGAESSKEPNTAPCASQIDYCGRLRVLCGVLLSLHLFQVGEQVVVLVLILMVNEKLIGVYYFTSFSPPHKVMLVDVALPIPEAWVFGWGYYENVRSVSQYLSFAYFRYSHSYLPDERVVIWEIGGVLPDKVSCLIVQPLVAGPAAECPIELFDAGVSRNPGKRIHYVALTPDEEGP